jgi:formylglycine-generating enzyme required for sulfatase activity
LVTLEGTRARQTEAELGAEAPERKEALAAMVRGRLLTASESPEGPVYEVSHEALINSWPTLKRWLEEDAEKRVLHDRLATAIAEWERLGRKREALWGGRQLAEATLLEASELLPREKEFLEASRRAVQLKRRVVATIAGVVLLALVGTYFGMQYKARRDLTAQVQVLVNEASSFLAQARTGNQQVEQLRREAFWFFDNKQVDKGEGVWEKALQGARETGTLYEKAGQSLEAAVALGKGSATAKTLLADVLYERALLAERDSKAETTDELLDRLRLYDDGSRRARWTAPGKVDIEVEPPGAQVSVQLYRERESQNPLLESLNLRLTTPVHDLELPQGSYLFVLTAPARAKVNLPILVRRGESRKASFKIPPAMTIPKGYVYVPPGSFLFGSARDEDARKYSLSTVPLHEVASRGFLIAQHETTFGEWLEYLVSLNRSDSLTRATTVGGKKGSVSLTPAGNDWVLRLQLPNHEHVMRLNDIFSLPERNARQSQNWRRLPVVGVTVAEIDGYLAWLERSGRLTRPRLCSEFQWEYAARGADGREYPHGNSLSVKEANFYDTYGKKQETMGPDEVGAHPESRSPFEIDDMSGNAWELTRSSFVDTASVLRGGGFANGPYDVRTTNRQLVSRTFSSVGAGFRVCANLQDSD